MMTVYPFQIIERIVEFSRHQIMDIMSACDPAYRALHKPNDIGAPDGRSYLHVHKLHILFMNYLCCAKCIHLLGHLMPLDFYPADCDEHCDSSIGSYAYDEGNFRL